MVGVEFANPSTSEHDIARKADAPQKLASRIAAKCQESGLLLLTTSVFEVIRFMPPLNVSEEEMAKACETFRKAVKDVVREG